MSCLTGGAGRTSSDDTGSGFPACSRIICVRWVSGDEGLFVTAHADGNLFVYDKVRLEHGSPISCPISSCMHAPLRRWTSRTRTAQAMSPSLPSRTLSSSLSPKRVPPRYLPPPSPLTTRCPPPHFPSPSPQSNPVARWHICGSPINDVAFSTSGALMATAGRDGKEHHPAFRDE